MRRKPGARALIAAVIAAVVLVGASTAPVGAASEWDVDLRAERNSTIFNFGHPDTATYGQTVTIPAGPTTLSRFSFLVDLPDDVVMRGAVHAWDAGTFRAVGAPLYLSDPVSPTGAEGFEEISFTPNLPAVPGTYVLYMTISYDYAANAGAERGPWGTVNPGPYDGGQAVFNNNSGDPAALATSGWSVWGGDMAFTMVFDEPLPNEPPVADAGSDQTVVLDEDGTVEVTLDGTGSSDPDGDELTFTWTGGFDEGTVQGDTPTVTFSAAGNYEVELLVDDGQATDTDTVTITVEEAEEPVEPAPEPPAPQPSVPPAPQPSVPPAPAAGPAAAVTATPTYTG